MKIIIKTKNLEITDNIKFFIEKKFNSIKKFINILKKDDIKNKKTLAEVFIELEKETRHHKKGNIFFVKTKVNLPGKTLIAKSKSDDLFKSIINAKDELKLEIEKHKLKKIDKNRRTQRKLKEKIII